VEPPLAMPRSTLLPTVPPTLRTERLILRAPVAADFTDYAGFLASERAQHMGGPYDRRGAWVCSAMTLRNGRCSAMAP
jgi:RimJ/RimL family protein N-acetyltransferase